MNSNFCKGCGQALHPNSRFCVNCGSAVADEQNFTAPNGARLIELPARHIKKHPIIAILCVLCTFWLIGRATGGSALAEDGRLHVIRNSPKDGKFLVGFDGQRWEMTCTDVRKGSAAMGGFIMPQRTASCDLSDTDGIRFFTGDRRKMTEEEITQQGLEMARLGKDYKNLGGYDPVKQEATILVFHDVDTPVKATMYQYTFHVTEAK